MSSMAHSKAHLRGLLILAPNTSLGKRKKAQQVLVLFSGADRGPRSGTVTAPEKETEQKNERKKQNQQKQTKPKHNGKKRKWVIRVMRLEEKKNLASVNKAWIDPDVQWGARNPNRHGETTPSAVLGNCSRQLRRHKDFSASGWGPCYVCTQNMYMWF